MHKFIDKLDKEFDRLYDVWATALPTTDKEIKEYDRYRALAFFTHQWRMNDPKVVFEDNEIAIVVIKDVNPFTKEIISSVIMVHGVNLKRINFNTEGI